MTTKKESTNVYPPVIFNTTTHKFAVIIILDPFLFFFKKSFLVTPQYLQCYTKFGCKKSFTIIFNRVSVVTRLTFTCSKSAIETLEKYVNHVQS